MTEFFVPELLSGDAAVSEANSLTARKQAKSEKFLAGVNEAAKLYGKVVKGDRRAALDMTEALTTSDFPILLGGVFDREMLARYEDIPKVWQEFAKRTVVKDFREKSFIDFLGGKGTLDRVGQGAEYPAASKSEKEYRISVGKFGRRFSITWEDIVNDMLGGFRDLPGDLAQAASDTEDFTAASAIASASGPNSAFFKTANGNAPDNKPLNTDNLAAALTAISSRKDPQGRPILVRGSVLVVPPSLEIAALAVLHATEIRQVVGDKTLITSNYLAGRVRLVVNPWLDVVDTSATSKSTWYILPETTSPRFAVSLGFLQGHEVPDLRVSADGGNRVGGGAVSAEDGSFEDDTIQYRVRHVLGSTTLEPIATYASKGA